MTVRQCIASTDGCTCHGSMQNCHDFTLSTYSTGVAILIHVPQILAERRTPRRWDEFSSCPRDLFLDYMKDVREKSEFTKLTGLILDQCGRSILKQKLASPRRSIHNANDQHV